MSFKTKDEYETEKTKWQSKMLQDRSPAGYKDFKSKENAWISSQEALKKKEGEAGTSETKSNTNSMQIKGNSGSSYEGDTLKIDPKSAEFVDFGTVFSEQDLVNPSEKFTKKKTFKNYLNKIKGKHFDEDGNLVVPEHEMPDRVKLSEKQQKANDAIDSQLRNNGTYKTKEIKMPTLTSYKANESYSKSASELSERLGINKDRPSNGETILENQKKRYTSSGALTIPDFSPSTDKGKELSKKGKKNTKLDGIKS